MLAELRDRLKDGFDWRQPGSILSAVGHATILLVGAFAFSSAQPFTPATEPVAVDVVSEKDFNEMMKGDKQSKLIAKEPERRVEKVAEVARQNAPGVEQKDVDSAEAPKAPAPTPKPPEPKQPEEKKVALVTPPTRPPELRMTQPKPAPAPAPKAEEEDDEEDQQAELLRKKKLEEKKKAEDAAKAAAEEKKKLEEKLKAEAEAEKRREEQKKAAEDRRKLEEKLKAEAEAAKKAEEKKAEEKRAEEKKKADAEKKAREDKAKKEQAAREAAEAEKLNNSIRQKLLASREAPASSGATGARLNDRSSAGNENASGKRLSPSDRAQLIGILTEQMNRCISYSGSAPKTGPQLTFTLTQSGGIAGSVNLANRSGEQNFGAFSEAAMRALRNCQPYRIPPRFLDSYEDWKNVRLNIDTSEMQ